MMRCVPPQGNDWHRELSALVKFSNKLIAEDNVAMPGPPKAFISWSSGKDSAFALQEARTAGLAEVVGAVTTVSEAYDRVARHGVRSSLLDRQIAPLAVP